MFSIDKLNVIRITRGDSATLSINLYLQSGAEYELQDGDRLVFSLKKYTWDEEYLLQKVFADNEIKFMPADTKNLDVADYVYDIQLTTADGDVYTVITPAKFTILPEVTTDE